MIDELLHMRSIVYTMEYMGCLEWILVYLAQIVVYSNKLEKHLTVRIFKTCRRIRYTGYRLAKRQLVPALGTVVSGLV